MVEKQGLASLPDGSDPQTAGQRSGLDCEAKRKMNKKDWQEYIVAQSMVCSASECAAIKKKGSYPLQVDRVDTYTANMVPRVKDLAHLATTSAQQSPAPPATVRNSKSAVPTGAEEVTDKRVKGSTGFRAKLKAKHDEQVSAAHCALCVHSGLYLQQ